MNALAKHAPGPWTHSPPKRGEKRKVRAFGGAYIVAADVAGEANARLISAAPELAAALLALVDTTNAHCPVDHPALPLARNILRKAGLLS